MVLTPSLLCLMIVAFFALLQLFYYLFFFARLAFYKKKIPTLHTPNEPISIIICAFNEEANLRNNLPIWLGQQYHKDGKPYFEVLVVNDNSEDDTFYFLNEMEKEHAHLHVLHLTQKAKLIPGKKFPLSMGIKSARFDKLLLTDADCTPASDQWLSSMANGFANDKKIVLGYSPYVKHPGWLNKCIRFETAHSAIQYFSFALAKLPYMGVGRNLAYTRELFNQNKGFSSHHHITSGDDDLFINQVANSQNTQVVIETQAFTYSEPKKTAEEWHYQKKRHLSTGKYYQTKHQWLLGGYAMSHFFFWLSLIPLIFFPGYLVYALGIVVFRWILMGLIFKKCFAILQEDDLSPFIWVFDIWLLFYNLKNIGAIFFKTHSHWK